MSGNVSYRTGSGESPSTIRTELSPTTEVATNRQWAVAMAGGSLAVVVACSVVAFLLLNVGLSPRIAKLILAALVAVPCLTGAGTLLFLFVRQQQFRWAAIDIAREKVRVDQIVAEGITAPEPPALPPPREPIFAWRYSGTSDGPVTRVSDGHTVIEGESLEVKQLGPVPNPAALPAAPRRTLAQRLRRALGAPKAKRPPRQEPPQFERLILPRHMGTVVALPSAQSSPQPPPPPKPKPKPVDPAIWEGANLTRSKLHACVEALYTPGNPRHLNLRTRNWEGTSGSGFLTRGERQDLWEVLVQAGCAHRTGTHANAPCALDVKDKAEARERLKEWLPE